MLDRTFASRFAGAWIAAWNAHDVEAVLAHYTDDVEFSSPFVAAIVGESSGVLRGKAALRGYWQAALQRIPDLKFTPLGETIGVNSMVIRYLSVHDTAACETLFFNAERKVYRAAAHYGGLGGGGADHLAAKAEPDAWLKPTHVTPILNVSDLQASFEWFDKLGWRKCWAWGDVPTFGAVGAGECEIFLCQNGQGGRGRGPNRFTSQGPGEDDTVDKGVWMSVWVRNVNEVHARCAAKGLDVTHPPTDEPWGVREMHVRHPDGHVFRISQAMSH